MRLFSADRDSARWGLDARDVQRRRALFWDLFVADSWQVRACATSRSEHALIPILQSLSTGRPPSVTLPYVDCQFPQDDEQRLNINGDKEHSCKRVLLSTELPLIPPAVGSWGFRFACECVGQVAAKTLTAQVPSYATILDLDRTVREFPVPEIPAGMLMDNTKPSAVMSRYVLSHTREVSCVSFYRSPTSASMADIGAFGFSSSSAVHSSQLLRAGDDRRSCEPPPEPVCAVLPCRVSERGAYPEVDQGAV